MGKFLDFIKKSYNSIWTPLSGQASGFRNRNSLQRNPETLDLSNAFQDVVFNCVNLIGSKASEVTYKVIAETNPLQKHDYHSEPVSRKDRQRLQETRRRKSIEYEQVLSGSPLLDLIYKSHRHDTFRQIVRKTFQDLNLSGNSFWLLDDWVGNYPTSIFVCPAWSIQPIRNAYGKIEGYQYSYLKQSQRLTTNQVLHFVFIPDPLDPYMGTSPARANWSAIDIQGKEQDYLRTNLDTYAQPRAIITGKDRPLNPDVQERIAKKYQNFFDRGQEAVLVLSEELNFTPLNWSNKDYAELQLFQRVREVLSNAFSIPIEYWTLGSANRSSAESVLYSLAVNCIAPQVNAFCDILNTKLVPLFGDDIFIEPNCIIPEDKEFLLKERDTKLKDKVLTVNSWLKLEGEKPVPWGDLPNTQPGEFPLLPVHSEDGEAKPIELLSTEQTNTLVTVLGQIKQGLLSKQAAAIVLATSLPLDADQVQAMVQGQPDVQEASKPEEAKPEAQTEQPPLEPAKAALTGIQITSMVSVCQAITDGTLTREAGRVILAQSFPDIPPDEINKLIDALEVKPEQETSTQAEAAPSPEEGKTPEGETSPTLSDEQGKEAKQEATQEDLKTKSIESPPRGTEALETALRAVFHRLGKQVIKKVSSWRKSNRKAYPDNFFNLNQAIEEMRQSIFPHVLLTYEENVKDTLAEYQIETPYAVIQPNILEAVKKQVYQLCDATLQTTELELNEAVAKVKEGLAAGLIAGDRQEALTQAVQQVFTNLDQFGSQRIAFTEAQRSKVDATVMTAKETGFAKFKQWLSSPDCCPLCAELSGKVVPIDEPFGVYGEGPYSTVENGLRHPLCRCNVLLLKDENPLN